MQAANDNEILVSMNRVCEMTSLSRSSVNIARGRGEFPAPVPLGEKRIGFVKAEVLGWIAERVNARTA